MGGAVRLRSKTFCRARDTLKIPCRRFFDVACKLSCRDERSWILKHRGSDMSVFGGISDITKAIKREIDGVRLQYFYLKATGVPERGGVD